MTGVAARRSSLDGALLLAVVGLMVPGLATLYSTGITDFPTVATGIWQRQLVWIAIGVLAAVAAFRFSPRVLEWFTPFVYGIACLLLVLTLIVGTGAGTAAGTKSWLAIGGVRIGQPAEVAKLATILMLARHLSARRAAPQTMFDLIPSGVIVGIPFILVGAQPDLGSALVFLGIFFTMMFWVGVRPVILLLVASPMISLVLAFSTGLWGAWIVAVTLLLLLLRPFVLEALTVGGLNVLMGIVAVRLWEGLAPYQQRRILAFLNPEIDPRATGWNIIQSKVAIGSGGVFGKGFTEGTQKRLAFLPAQHTDFVFPVWAEEFGFLGVVIALFLFAFFFMNLVRLASRAVDGFSSLVLAGIIGMLFTHVVENVGMTAGLLPVTGIPLPFFSYGGSFMVICLVSMGLAFRIAWDSQHGGYLEG